MSSQIIKVINHDCAVGLGSTIMRALHCLFYRQNNELFYFNFYNSDYSDKNVWNAFFEQPFKKEIGTAPVKVEYVDDIWKMGDFFLCYGNKQNKMYGKDQFERPDRVGPLRDLWKSHIKIKSDVIQPAESFYLEHFKQKKVLGVHKRGTDQFGPNGHARGQQHLLDEGFYIKTIDQRLSEQHFDNIFLSTDEQRAVDVLTKRYGSMLLKQQTVLCPPNNNEGIHNLYKKTSENIRNQIGAEVLRDIYLLSKCDFCLNVKSNVSLASIFMRNDFNYAFIDNHVDYGALG